MNMPPACVYSAEDGNGKIGRQAAYLPDHCLRDGVGGRNGNSRLLATAAAIRKSFTPKYFSPPTNPGRGVRAPPCLPSRCTTSSEIASFGPLILIVEKPRTSCVRHST